MVEDATGKPPDGPPNGGWWLRYWDEAAQRWWGVASTTAYSIRSASMEGEFWRSRHPTLNLEWNQSMFEDLSDG